MFLRAFVCNSDDKQNTTGAQPPVQVEAVFTLEHKWVAVWALQVSVRELFGLVEMFLGVMC